MRGVVWQTSSRFDLIDCYYCKQGALSFSFPSSLKPHAPLDLYRYRYTFTGGAGPSTLESAVASAGRFMPLPLPLAAGLGLAAGFLSGGSEVLGSGLDLGVVALAALASGLVGLGEGASSCTVSGGGACAAGFLRAALPLALAFFFGAALAAVRVFLGPGPGFGVSGGSSSDSVWMGSSGMLDVWGDEAGRPLEPI